MTNTWGTLVAVAALENWLSSMAHQEQPPSGYRVRVQPDATHCSGTSDKGRCTFWAGFHFTPGITGTGFHFTQHSAGMTGTGLHTSQHIAGMTGTGFHFFQHIAGMIGTGFHFTQHIAGMTGTGFHISQHIAGMDGTGFQSTRFLSL